jgi:transposase
MYCGIDLANKTSAICIRRDRAIFSEQECSTDEDAFKQALKGFGPLTIVIEACAHAEWVAIWLEKLGHEVKVIDPRRAAALIRTKKKTDKLDARQLARLAETQWYHEVHRKSEKARLLRSHLRARQGLVDQRLAQVFRIRGLLRVHGLRVGKVSKAHFIERVRQLCHDYVPDLLLVIEPLLAVLQSIRDAEAALTRRLKQVARQEAECRLLMTMPGVGPMTAVAFVSSIDDPSRFKRGDQVAAYMGLVPSVYQTGETRYTGSITCEGDKLTRTLLAEASNSMLVHYKGDCALKRWGQRLVERKGGGKARVAVARKMAMVLHRMWLNNEPFNALA